MPDEYPGPMQWPAAPAIHCQHCNNPCVANVIEKGATTATYVCAEEHDTFIMATKEHDGAWAFGEVPF